MASLSGVIKLITTISVTVMSATTDTTVVTVYTGSVRLNFTRRTVGYRIRERQQGQ